MFYIGAETGARACLVPIKKYALSGQLEAYSDFYRYVRELFHDLTDPLTGSQIKSLIEKRMRLLGAIGWLDAAIGYKLYLQIADVVDNTLIPL